jgi:hypothetical protein
MILHDIPYPEIYYLFILINWGIDHQIGGIIKIPQELRPRAET